MCMHIIGQWAEIWKNWWSGISLAFLEMAGWGKVSTEEVRYCHMKKSFPSICMCPNSKKELNSENWIFNFFPLNYLFFSFYTVTQRGWPWNFENPWAVFREVCIKFWLSLLLIIRQINLNEENLCISHSWMGKCEPKYTKSFQIGSSFH